MTEDVMKPGEVYKPFITKSQVEDLLERLYGMTAETIKEFNSYDDRNFFLKVKAKWNNDYVENLWPSGYIMKITNTFDSKNESFHDAQNQLMLHLAKNGFLLPEPIRNLNGKYFSVECIEVKPCDDWPNNNLVETSRYHIVRLLKFIPGKILYEIPWTVGHFFQAGDYIGRLYCALKNFSHPAYETRDSIWYLSKIPQVQKDYSHVVEDKERYKMINEIFSSFNNEVIKNKARFETNIIHGDFNEQNILVNKNENDSSYFISSVIDFGDSQKNPVIFELGITIMYMMTKCEIIDPNLAGGHVIAGYLKHRKIPPCEMDVLKTIVAARYAQSLTLGYYSYLQDKSNEYVLVTAKTGWKNLKNFWNIPKEDLYKSWQQIIDSY